MCEVDKNAPDVIYHYTNQDGLLGIIGNNSLWATNILYLNDYKEHIIGKELLDDVFKSSIEKMEVGRELSQQFFEYIINQPVFVTSFSAERDLLSQWRGYGKDSPAFSIGFNVSRLLNALNTQLFRFGKMNLNEGVSIDEFNNTILTAFNLEVSLDSDVFQVFDAFIRSSDFKNKIHYLHNKKYRCMENDRKKLISEAIDFIENDNCKDNEAFTDRLHVLNLMFPEIIDNQVDFQYQTSFCFIKNCIYGDEKQIESIKKITDYNSNNISLPFNMLEAQKTIPVIKSKGFSEELETRLFFISANEKSPNFKYRKGKSSLIPYYEIKFNSILDVIDNITIGPCDNIELAVNALKNYIYKINPDKIRNNKDFIKTTEIPYRNW